MMFKKRIGYLLLILFIFATLLIPQTRQFVYRLAGDFFYPFISMVYNFNSYVEKKSDLSKSKTELIDEIAELKKQNTLLAAKSNSIALLRRENRELHQLLGLKSNPFYNYIFSEIISRDPVQWFQQFTINKGTNDGIENGALVIARINNDDEFDSGNIEFAVVGRISAVSNHTAVVDTIINDDCRLSIIIPGNGATGILSGGGRNGRQLWSQIEYLPRDLKYEAGEIVQTSGLNEFTPPAIKVGEILSVKSSPVEIYNDLYARVKIRPFIDFNHLKFVLVLVKK